MILEELVVLVVQRVWGDDIVAEGGICTGRALGLQQGSISRMKSRVPVEGGVETGKAIGEGGAV